MKKVLFSALAIMFLSQAAVAWDGTDQETGAPVEIEQGNLVRSGEDIQILDYSTGDYRNLTVDNIDRQGTSVEIQGYDMDTGEYRTFEMEDR